MGELTFWEFNLFLFLFVVCIGGSILLAGCLIPNSAKIAESVCWEHLSKPSVSAADCLEVAEQNFDLVCNDVFNNKIFCDNLWDSTEISFDPVNQECFMSLPVECGGVVE